MRRDAGGGRPHAGGAVDDKNNVTARPRRKAAKRLARGDGCGQPQSEHGEPRHAKGEQEEFFEQIGRRVMLLICKNYIAPQSTAS